MFLRIAFRSPLRAVTTTSRNALKPFSASALSAAKPLPPRRTIDDAEIEEKFLKGSGPGGQKINKTSSAVQLKHLPTGMVIKSQATRSRSQNRKIARRILGEKLEALEKGPESRTARKVEVKRKKKASKIKKAKRKYRALGEGEEKTTADDDDGDDDDDDDDEEDVEEVNIEEVGRADEQKDVERRQDNVIHRNN